MKPKHPEQPKAPEAPVEPIQNDAVKEAFEAAAQAAPAPTREEELLSQLQRLQAEFENYRKRVGAEAANALEKGKESAIKELLPIIDAIELAATHANTPEGKEALVKGVTSMHNQTAQALERLGVTEIPLTGTVNPHHHEVYVSETTDMHPENTVIQTLQKGYTRNGTILRTAKVKAARAKQ